MSEPSDNEINNADELTVAESTEERLAHDPLLRTIGDSPKSRILLALLSTHPQPLSPSNIAESAGIDRTTWYDHKDDLLELEVIEQRGNAGNSPLYGIVDDERLEALRTLQAKSGEKARNAR